MPDACAVIYFTTLLTKILLLRHDNMIIWSVLFYCVIIGTYGNKCFN